MKGFQVCSNKRPHPFPKGDNNEKAKMNWQNFKIYFSRKNLTVMGKGNWNYLNVVPSPFPKGDNKEIAKIHFPPESMGQF